MEIYKSLTDPASKEFEKLLNSQLSKTKIEEGKIIEGKINKITEKYVFLFCEGLKQEAILDINELRGMGLADKIKLNETLSVLLERIEHPKTGEIVVSASKAQKIKGWESIVALYEAGEPVVGKITGRVKGGAIVEHIDTGTQMFLPGSQIASAPLKSIDHLINEVQKFAIIKLDRVRGNICCSRREILDAGNKASKAELIKKYPVGTVIKDAKVKNLSSFGMFASVNEELDVLVHTSELSYSRVNHPDELFSIGETVQLKVITNDPDKLQVGCSIRALSPDPFENIDQYEIGKEYDAKVMKLMDFGIFVEIAPGLVALCHSSEISYSKKNASPKKFFKIGDTIKVIITDINKENRRIAVSYKLTQENPFKVFEQRFPVGTIVEGEIVNKNEYSLWVKVEDLDCDCFCHQNDLTFLNNGEEELAKYKKGEKIKVKVLEINIEEQKIRVGYRQTKPDPFDFFKDKKQGQILTVKIISTDNKKGLFVRPENCEMDFQIKKSEIAINAADARASRFTGGERIDCAIQNLDLSNRKVSLSIKYLEEQDRKTALEKYGSEGSNSGKNLPFKTLSEDLKKKDKTKK